MVPAKMVPSRRASRRNAPRFELNLTPRELTPAVSPNQSSEFARDGSGCSANSVSTAATTSTSTTASDVFGPNIIIPNLFLGNHGDACDEETIEALNIKWVLNVAEECEVRPWLAERCCVKHIHLRDHSDQPVAPYFAECAAFIDAALDCGENILVHCKMGYSRAATIVMAYLMMSSSSSGKKNFRNETNQNNFNEQQQQQKQRLHSEEQFHSYQEAFDRVKQRRPLVSPNLGFVLALHALDASISSISSPVDDVDGDGKCGGGKFGKLIKTPSSNSDLPIMVAESGSMAADEEAPSSRTSVGSDWIFMVSPSISVYS